MRRVAVPGFALLVCMCAAARAQTVSWTLLKPTGSQPSARYDGAIAWDTPGRQVILFGGSDNFGNRNDL